MATPRLGNPYMWVTYITRILAGDAECSFAPWFKAHYTYEPVPSDGGFDLAKWKVEHSAMLHTRAAALLKDGWTVYLEEQNKFVLKGKVATLGGKPDLVAVKGNIAKVIDEKSGKRRDSDIQQVLLYLLVLPQTHQAVRGKELWGEVEYRDGVVPIAPQEFTAAVRDHLIETIKQIADPTAPPWVPSARECAFCDIPKSECPDRIERATEAAVLTSEF